MGGSESPPPPPSNIDNNAMAGSGAGRGEAGHWPVLLTTPTHQEEDRITISYHPLRSGAEPEPELQLDIGIHWVLAYHGPEQGSGQRYQWQCP